MTKMTSVTPSPAVGSSVRTVSVLWRQLSADCQQWAPTTIHNCPDRPRVVARSFSVGAKVTTVVRALSLSVLGCVHCLPAESSKLVLGFHQSFMLPARAGRWGEHTSQSIRDYFRHNFISLRSAGTAFQLCLSRQCGALLLCGKNVICHGPLFSSVVCSDRALCSPPGHARGLWGVTSQHRYTRLTRNDSEDEKTTTRCLVHKFV